MPKLQSRYKEDYKMYPTDPEITGKIVDLAPDIYCQVSSFSYLKKISLTTNKINIRKIFEYV